MTNLKPLNRSNKPFIQISATFNLSSSLNNGFRPQIGIALGLTLLKMYRDALKKRWEVNGCLLVDCF
jgi:hypothetical protein